MISMQAAYFLAYRRFIGLLRPLARLPWALAYPSAGWLARYFSPYRQQRDTILPAFQACLALEPQSARQAWHRYLAQHGVFVLNGDLYRRMDLSWIRRHVEIRGEDCLQAMKDSPGGLVLTWHSHHHHALFCVLGLLGLELRVIAQSAESSPAHAWLGKEMEKLHADTRRHFGRGDYLFFTPPENVIRPVLRALDQGQWVVSLNDNLIAPGKRSVEINLLGRCMTCPAGSLELALRAGAPIFLALFYWRGGGRFVLELARLEPADTQQMMQAYFDFLAVRLRRHPDIWEGWQWLAHCPPN